MPSRIIRYPAFRPTQNTLRTVARLKMYPQSQRDLVKVLHNLVLSIFDVTETQDHRRWCCGQVSVVCFILDQLYPRES